MLLLILEWLEPIFPKFTRLALFEYITVRSGMALAVAFLASVMAGPRVIQWLRTLRASGQIRKATREGVVDVYATHQHKSDTPIMGGILIIGAVGLATLVLCDWRSVHVWVALLALLGFAGIGLIDDGMEIRSKRLGLPKKRGLSASRKMALQVALSAVLAYLIVVVLPEPVYHDGQETIVSSTCLTVPFFKKLYPNLGMIYMAFIMLVIVAASNAVNLTDGLDGLAIGITIITALALAVVIYLVTRVDYARYLYFPYIKGGGELVILCLALVGAGMGFLWYNSHPASVFMGDTGSLAIGGLLGTLAVMVRQELLLVIIGGIFVVEAVSVIIQVTSYKLRKKRVFLMTPIHHHFEKKGWHEEKIIARFWILAALLALVGLSTLKIR